MQIASLRMSTFINEILISMANEPQQVELKVKLMKTIVSVVT